MAKDGTRRGGARVGAGRKPKALYDRIEADDLQGATILPEPADMAGYDMPPIKEFMKAKQRDGKDLEAEAVFKEVWKWLQARGCEQQVNVQLIEQYAMAVARWVQCEEAISEFGFLAKHPTTKAAIASPYVSMSQNYQKQVQQCWFQIYQIVKETCSVDYHGPNPQDDLMERLLKGGKGA